MIHRIIRMLKKSFRMPLNKIHGDLSKPSSCFPNWNPNTSSSTSWPLWSRIIIIKSNHNKLNSIQQWSRSCWSFCRSVRMEPTKKEKEIPVGTATLALGVTNVHNAPFCHIQNLFSLCKWDCHCVEACRSHWNSRRIQWCYVQPHCNTGAHYRGRWWAHASNQLCNDFSAGTV